MTETQTNEQKDRQTDKEQTQTNYKAKYANS